MARKAGSKNKKTKELEAKLAEALPGWDPVAWMAKIAAEGLDPQLSEPIMSIALLLEGVKPKTNNDSRKLNKAKQMLEHILAGAAVEKDLRITCAKEVANYLHPKRKAVELKTGDGQVPVRVEQNFGPSECPHCHKPLR